MKEKLLDLIWPVLAFLPEGPLFTDCATCLFWRGALFGGAIVGLVAILLF